MTQFLKIYIFSTNVLGEKPESIVRETRPEYTLKPAVALQRAVTVADLFKFDFTLPIILRIESLTWKLLLHWLLSD